MYLTCPAASVAAEAIELPRPVVNVLAARGNPPVLPAAVLRDAWAAASG